MNKREDEVKKARRFLDLIKDFEDKGSWVKDFLSSIGSDITEALPPMKSVRGYQKIEKTGKLNSLFKSKEENKREALEGAEELVGGFAETGTSLFPIGGMAKSSAEKLKSLVGARKLGNAKAWIEKAGGKVLKIGEDGIATWKDKLGKVRKSNLTDRFGPRDVGLSSRQLRENPRAEDADELLDLAKQHKGRKQGNFVTDRASKDDIVSRVSEKSGVSREEMKARAIEEKQYDRNLDDFEDEELQSFGEKRVNKPKMSSNRTKDDPFENNPNLPPISERPKGFKNALVANKPFKGTDTEYDELAGAYKRIEEHWKETDKLPPTGRHAADHDIKEIKPGHTYVDNNGSRWDITKVEGDKVHLRRGMGIAGVKNKIVSQEDVISRRKPIEGLTAADSTGASTEEVARAGSFYKIGKHGEPTYLSKAVDAGNLGPDEAIIQVIKGQEPKIYQGSGPASALNRFKKTRTGAQFYKFEAGAGAKPPKGHASKVIRSAQLPEIHTSRFANALTDKLGNRKIKFASDFDKVAYNLALSKVPDKKILSNVLKQLEKDNPNITANTILQHGERIKIRVNQAQGKGTIKLNPRSLQIIEPAKNPSLRRQILGLPSEYLFAGDLPTLRQHLRPVLTHPFKTGIPSVRRALKGITEKGYREELEKMPDELGLFDVLDTMDAIGPSKAKELYPYGEDLRKLSAGNTYDYFGTGNLGEKIPFLGELPKASRRMFDLATRSVRGTEADRMVKLLGTDVQGLAKKGHSELDAMNRSILEHSGHGPLGNFERAGEELSTLFTSPRNTMASAQTWNPLNYLPESALPKFITDKGLGGRYGTDFKSPIYRDNLKDTAKMVAGYGGLEAADKMLGDDETINFNPLDTNVGANFGNWRPDLFGSAKGVATLIPKMLQPLLRKGANALDETFDTDLEDTFTGQNAKGEPMNFSPMDELEKFIRYRLRPGVVSLAGDLTLGYNDDKGEPGDDIGTFTNAIGKDIFKPYSEDAPIMSTPLKPLAELPGSKWIGDQFTTSWPTNVYDAYEGAGIPQAIAAALTGGLGSGSATYDPFEQETDEYRAPYKSIKVPLKPKKKKKRGGGIG